MSDFGYHKPVMAPVVSLPTIRSYIVRGIFNYLCTNISMYQKSVYSRLVLLRNQRSKTSEKPQASHKQEERNQLAQDEQT